MKTNRSLGACFALLFGLSSLLARAENVGAASTAGSPSAAAESGDGSDGAASSPAGAAQEGAAGATASSGRKRSPKKHQSRIDVLAEKLTLTEAQKEKISLILKDQRAAEKQLKKDISLPDDLRRTRRREIANSHEDQIREVLSQEQRAAFDKLTAKEHARSRM